MPRRKHSHKQPDKRKQINRYAYQEQDKPLHHLSGGQFSLGNLPALLIFQEVRQVLELRQEGGRVLIAFYKNAGHEFPGDVHEIAAVGWGLHQPLEGLSHAV